MKNRWQIKTGEALCERGVLKAPLRGCPFLPANVGGTERIILFHINQYVDLVFVRLPKPLNLRGGLKPAPSFKATTAKVIDFAWFSSLTKLRGAATSSTKVGRVSFFSQVLKQIFHNFFKASHKAVLQNWSVPIFTYQHSEGEMECGSRNQGMRCQK